LPIGHALLINPSYAGTYGSNEGGIAYPVYPILSLAAIGGALKQRGHTFRILDLSYRPYDPELIRDVLREEQPQVLGVTATTPLMNQARDISYIAREIDPDITTIVGGAHASAMPAETLGESVFDLVACGECDFVMADLLEGVDPADIGGLWRRADGDIVNTGPAGLIGDLDDLPLPAWEDYPVESTRMTSSLIARHQPVTSMEFSRGCIYSCDFCASKNTMGRGYRKKTPERCADELQRIQDLGFREAVLHDDIFTTDTRWAAAVCEAIIERGIDVAWTCSNGIRVDAVDERLFNLMKQAGCYRVYFGFETGNEDVLKEFGKGGQATLDKGIEAVDMARDAGLEPNGFFMVGLMPDTEESMQDTIDYARKVRLDAAKCGICVPYPGTPMFRALYDAGNIKSLDWDAYTVYNTADNIFDHPTLDWDTVNRYFKRFYRQVYLMNPRYLVRRLRYLLRNGELWRNVGFAFSFFRLLARSEQADTRPVYAYEADWRKLDITNETTVGEYVVPRVRRRGTALKTPSAKV
jgi:anaerobic magnesium-protoporphyrin IX monomethyl ester cyclase